MFVSLCFCVAMVSEDDGCCHGDVSIKFWVSCMFVSRGETGPHFSRNKIGNDRMSISDTSNLYLKHQR